MDNPISNLEKLSEPVTKLVEVVSQGIGTLYSPFGTLKQAKADAKAKIIHAKADEEVANIQARAQSRLMHREVLRQENIEKIVVKASNEMPDAVSDESVESDWVLQFFDHAQDVCDEDLQTLWARILSGEVASPGNFSKRTIQFLKTLDKREAEKFTQLCSFGLKLDGWNIIIGSQATSECMKEVMGPGGWLDHFSNIGLLNSSASEIVPSSIDGEALIYHNDKYLVKAPEKKKTGHYIELPEFPMTVYFFSVIGQQLSEIAESNSYDDYVELLEKSLKQSKYEISFIKEGGSICS